MPDLITNPLIDDVTAQAMQLGLCFLDGPGRARQVPFTLTPTPIARATLQQLEVAAPLLGRLTEALAARHELIEGVHAPLLIGDPFFAEMLGSYRELHGAGDKPARLPLLLQRSDFMVDEQAGAQLVECNSIAAGMAPFGEQVQKLHHYIHKQWPSQFSRYSAGNIAGLLPNPATTGMATAIAAAARRVAAELDHSGDPGFLMVVQEEEDNIFDQRLLEQQLRQLGLQTYRRSFRQLHEQLSTGPRDSLQLAGCGDIHVVYLRAGYQYQDYVATDLDTRRCCEALTRTRIFIERHRVAVNATLAQQLATSKRMQLHVALGAGRLLEELGFDKRERTDLEAIITPMRTVDRHTLPALLEENSSPDWVLKNQGEGGGHCLFDRDIMRQLETMEDEDYPAWVLMRRLRPTGRAEPTLVVRNGRAQQVGSLVSEIGMFTAHLDGQPLPVGGQRSGYAGYLVRSKPPEVTEAGVHSGFGALDSLVLLE
jgi:glutathione synthase